MNLVELVRTKLTYNSSTGEMFWIKGNKYHPNLSGKKAGFFNTDGRNIISLNGKQYKRSRLAVIYMTGVIPEIVDHINGDQSDDRWINLRVTNHLGNNKNFCPEKKIMNKVSGLPIGVRLNKGRYDARISKDRKTWFLGLFPSIKEASNAYQAAKLELHGQFARRLK